MKKIFQLTLHPLFSGSIMMIAGSNIANAINYFYHLLAGRLLAPESYGELVSLISLSGLLAIIPASLSLVIVKYVSAAKTEANTNALICWFRARIFQLSLVVFVLLVIISPMIKSFLHFSNSIYVIAMVIAFLFSLSAILNRSILQGLLKFKEATLSIILENSTRLMVGILLIYSGLNVGGAMTGLVVAAIAGWYLSRFYLRNYVKGNLKLPPNIGEMIVYSIPVIVQSAALISIYSSDLILVKHFFSSHDAGIYAALSTLGKIIFFGASPIAAVMFPLVSQRQVKNQDYKKIFVLSLITTLILALLVMAVYWLVPELAINLLYGPAYQEAAKLLIWFGIFMTLFTLSSLLINFHLSLGRTKVVYLPAVSAILQIAAIWIYHDSLFMVILISVIATALLLGLLLIYSCYATPGNQINLSDRAGLQKRKNDCQGS